MRATPKTSSPKRLLGLDQSRAVFERTFTDLRTEGDVLLSGALNLLLGRHVCGIVEDWRRGDNEDVSELQSAA